MGRASDYIQQKNGISLSMKKEYQDFLQSNTTDFLEFLKERYQASSTNWDEIEKKALHWFTLKQEEISIN
jgi:hypothetical protein